MNVNVYHLALHFRCISHCDINLLYSPYTYLFLKTPACSPMQKSTAFDGDSKDKDEMNGNAAAKKEGGSLNVQDDKAKARGYWLPRHEMVNLMSECIDEHNSQNDSCKIEVLMGQECVDVLPTKRVSAGQNVACVKVRNAKDGSLKLLEAKLVVGADGMNSKVRECLGRAPNTLWRQSSSSTKGTFNPKKFLLKKWTSPASHLRIKVLQLPPQFEIPNAPGFPAVKTNSEDIYAFRSVNTGPRDYLSLGLLPMKDNNAVRPTNIVTRPDHEVWEIKDGASMQAYFQKAFPRFNFSKGGMISDEEFERFAKAEGTRFPPCQFSEGLAVWDESGTCGVALVGDAIHAFSPDIGQGVNAGLVDVACLDRALRGLDTTTGKDIEQPGKADKKESLQTSLERYQKEHAPEIAALIRLARFGAPYQYNQPHRADRILKKFWTANVVLRLLLNKLTFGLVQPQCIILAGNNDLTFRQVMRRADLTTALFKTILVGVLGLLVKQRFGFGFLKALF